VGRYLILNEVQAGGMGVVYRARDTDLNRIVALKMVKAGPLATAEEVVRFHREAEAAARLEHPNIVPVYDIGRHEGCLYFTMAFAGGGTLAEHQGRFVADPRAAVALLEKVAGAVHHAHQRRVLHRDLKPANILFDDHGSPWVSDFGLAKLADAGLDLTQTGQPVGTPAYMAPEQAGAQAGRVSAPTDVWALGVILYELVTGRRPFTGSTRDERLRQILTADPPRPRAVRRSLDRGLETVILKCLEKDPSRRYGSAEALAEDLGRWLRGEPVLARPQPWPARAWRAARPWHRPALRLGGAGVLLALLALTWKGLSPSGPPDEPEDPAQRQSLQEKLQQLHDGQAVTLIGDSGPPVWSRWQPHRLDARRIYGTDQVFRVAAWKQPGMLELLPETPPRYVLRARVQHCESMPLGQVGIYFAHARSRNADGATHCFFRVAFNDRVVSPTPAGSVVSLTLPLDLERGGQLIPHLDTDCKAKQLFTPAGNAEPMPWRRLAVEVTPEKIRTFWDGTELPPCNRKDALRWASVLLANTVVHPKAGPPPPVPDTDLVLGEGLGLYVDKGVAAFQSVVIEPLPEK
jgi:serine/threonine-protein kinase